MLNKLFEMFRGLFNLEMGSDDEPLPEPELRRQIGYAELYELLHEKFPKAQIFLSDREKYLCDISDIEAFLAQDETNHYIYEREALDCDDFTYMLMGEFSKPSWAQLAKCIVWTDVHALLGFIDTNKDFFYIEPQADEIQPELKKWQGSKVRLIVM